MYEYISGRLERLAGELAVVDVGGVGYRLRVPVSTSDTLRPGRDVRLYVTHRLSQEIFQLYGFASRDEREIFERVCAVSGVGPSIALSILSALPIDRFREVVMQGDSKALEKVRGVGKKTAQRLILELRGVLAAEDLQPVPAPDVPEAATDAIKALVSLGFTPAESEARVRRALETAPESSPVGELVRLASRNA